MGDHENRRELAELLAGAGASEEEQLAFLPPAGGVDAEDRQARALEAVRADRRGRPAGAKNLATRQALDFIRRVLGDPLIDRARWAMHTPETLARELGCSRLEAFDRLDRMRADLARYFYAPLAPVDDKGRPVVPFFAMQIGPAGAPGTAARPPWEYEQIQEVSAAPPAVSHAAQSHEGDK